MKNVWFKFSLPLIYVWEVAFVIIIYWKRRNSKQVVILKKLDSDRQQCFAALICVVLIGCFSRFRSLQETVTTTSTNRTSLSRRSTADTFASCRGSGTSASPYEWSSWAVTSSTSQYLLPPSPPFSSCSSSSSSTLLSHTCTALLSAPGGSNHQSSHANPGWLEVKMLPLTIVTRVQIELSASMSSLYSLSFFCSHFNKQPCTFWFQTQLAPDFRFHLLPEL